MRIDRLTLLSLSMGLEDYRREFSVALYFCGAGLSFSWPQTGGFSMYACLEWPRYRVWTLVNRPPRKV